MYILTLLFDSRIIPPGLGSCIPAPRREKTSPLSSRDVIRRNDGGDAGTSEVLTISPSSLNEFWYKHYERE